MIYPRLLDSGDTVAIVAPAGPCDPTRLARGVRVLESLGLHCRIMDSCFTQNKDETPPVHLPVFGQASRSMNPAHPPYLSAPDAQRAYDLHSAFADPNIRAVMCARGGYGSQRLLPLLDFDLIRRNPKIITGYSDITALHIAFNQRCSLVTYHAPMIAADFGNEGFGVSEADAATLHSFQSALFASSNKKPRIFKPIPGKRVGNNSPPFPALPHHPIVGGNLSVVTATLGTPYEIITRNRILFLEEINEPPYRIDRMLTQLQQAGKLDDAAGFLFGDFTPLSPHEFKTLLANIKIPPGKPIIMGFPGGHTSPNITLRLGG